MISFIVEVGCILILKFYLKSISLEIEWKFDFFMVGCIIFKSLMNV